MTARTADFKAKFGDWEDPKVRAKSARIDKLIASAPITLPQPGKPDLSQMSRKEIRAWAMDNLREAYKNEYTGEEIIISRNWIEEVTHHSMQDPIHKMTIAYIPDLIRHSDFLGELKAEHHHSAYPMFRYYAVGLKINGADYTARLSVGVDENGTRYYDHGLTQIEKKKLVGYLNQPVKGFTAIRGEHEGTPHLSSALDKDSKLTTLLQGYIPGELLEENGEPTSQTIEAYERGEETRFRKGDKAPTKQEWNGEWYDTPDMRGMTVADAMGLPVAPALPRKRATEPIADYAERVTTHYKDPRVRFRTGQRAPEPPKITESMSLYEIAQKTAEYNRAHKDYVMSSMQT